MVIRNRSEELPPWMYEGNVYDKADESYIGFIYEIEYTDGRKYIGKKNLFSTKTVKARKDGKLHEGTIDRKYRNTGKGFRQAFDIVKTESDWRTYTGSSKNTENLVVSKRTVLKFCKSKYELTYYEAKYLFFNEVLENEDYINDNILGTFYGKGKNSLLQHSPEGD